MIHSARSLKETELSCDVCVVGSGAGGAMAAYDLARAGLAVLLIERGSRHARASHDQREGPMLLERSARSGFLYTDDLEVNIAHGRCLGGTITLHGRSEPLPPP